MWREPACHVCELSPTQHLWHKLEFQAKPDHPTNSLTHFYNTAGFHCRWMPDSCLSERYNPKHKSRFPAFNNVASVHILTSTVTHKWGSIWLVCKLQQNWYMCTYLVYIVQVKTDTVKSSFHHGEIVVVNKGACRASPTLPSHFKVQRAPTYMLTCHSIGKLPSSCYTDLSAQ